MFKQQAPRTSVRSDGVGAWGLGNSPQLMSSTPPPVVLLCLSWGVRNNTHRSQLQTLIWHHIPQVIEPCHCCQAYGVIMKLQYHISIIKLSRSVIIHTCTVTVLLCYWNGNKIAVLLYYMCTVYSTDFVRHTVLPLIRFGVVYCSLANALPHFRL